MSYVIWRVPLLIKLRPEKKYSCLAIGWNVWGSHELGLFWRVPRSNYNWKKRHSCLAIGCNVGLFWQVCRCVFWRVPQSNYKLRPKKKVQLSGYRLECCLYLKQGTKLNIGIVWFEGKAPSQTSKTCLTMEEPFTGPSSIAMGNQPMPLRYPLCKRLSEGGVRGFLLTP